MLYLSQRHEQISHSPCSGVGSVQQGVLRQVCVTLGCLQLRVAEDFLHRIQRSASVDQEAGVTMA